MAQSVRWLATMEMVIVQLSICGITRGYSKNAIAKVAHRCYRPAPWTVRSGKLASSEVGIGGIATQQIGWRHEHGLGRVWLTGANFRALFRGCWCHFMFQLAGCHCARNETKCTVLGFAFKDEPWWTMVFPPLISWYRLFWWRHGWLGETKEAHMLCMVIKTNW